MIAAGLLLGVGIAAALLAVRLVRGPTPYDQLLMGHALWMHAALLVAALGALAGSHDALDAALLIAVLGVVPVLAAVKALRRNSFQPALAPRDDAGAP